MDAKERLLSKIRHEGECWVFTGYCDAYGYGMFWYKTANVQAHRVSYMLHVGPIPDGLEIDHTCKNTSCINPKHLEAVTHPENMRRGYRANQTHCKHNHPLSGDNLIIRANGLGRDCKACRDRRHAARITIKQLKEHYPDWA